MSSAKCFFLHFVYIFCVMHYYHLGNSYIKGFAQREREREREPVRGRCAFYFILIWNTFRTQYSRNKIAFKIAIKSNTLCRIYINISLLYALISVSWVKNYLQSKHLFAKHKIICNNMLKYSGKSVSFVSFIFAY